MTTSILIECIEMFIGAQILDLLLIQVPKLRRNAAAANKPFKFKEWWSCDWNLILAGPVFMIVVTIGYEELIGFNPAFSKYARWIYAGIGGFGSSILMENWGKYGKNITQLFSLKSNISDVVTGGTTTVQDTIKKGEERLNQDITNNPTI